MSQHVFSLRTNYTVFAVLMALLVATVGASFLPMGSFHLPVAMTIAVIKAALILTYFMHLRYSSRLTWAFATAAFLWLIVLIVFTVNDYASRGWIDVLGK